jgi:hypothetical protein
LRKPVRIGELRGRSRAEEQHKEYGQKAGAHHLKVTVSTREFLEDFSPAVRPKKHTVR